MNIALECIHMGLFLSCTATSQAQAFYAWLYCVRASSKGPIGYGLRSRHQASQVPQETDLSETFWALFGCSDVALCEFSVFSIEKKYFQ